MLHPFMGIQNWNKEGLSIEQSTYRLRRIAYLDRQCMHIAAGWMIACPEYEIKGAFGKIAWQDAEHHEQLRSRCKQMRLSPTAFDKSPDSLLTDLAINALNSGSLLQLLTALFEVIKPAQIAAIQTYLQDAQPLVDQPTIHILRHQLIDRQEQLQWGQEAIQHIADKAEDEDRASAYKWKDYLQAIIDSAGGIDGIGERAPLVSASEYGIAAKPFRLPDHSPRDERFKTAIGKFEGIELPDNDEGIFKAMMYSRYFEMSTSEGVAYLLFQIDGKPWEFYYDTARHLWDEVRHSWFGEAALRHLGYDIYEAPNWIGFYEIFKNLFEPEEAYIHLTVAIEKAAMKYPPGKRQEWEFCRDVVKDPLMTTFQDFDWADEVVHAGFGKKWAIDRWLEGDGAKAKQLGDETWAKRDRFMEQYAVNGKQQKTSFAGGY